MKALMKKLVEVEKEISPVGVVFYSKAIRFKFADGSEWVAESKRRAMRIELIEGDFKVLDVPESWSKVKNETDKKVSIKHALKNYQTIKFY